MSIDDKLISDEEKHLTNTIDGIEYGVTNKGCIYYETPKGKQIIVCNFFMQLIRINDDLTDNKAYTFNVILQEGKAQKEVVLSNYNLKNSRWIDNLGMEYHLGKYAKYKDLKIYISNLIVEKMPETDMKIENVIDNIKKRKITTEKNLDLGKNFLLGLNRLIEADNNEYIASSRYNINMSDSNKVLGFKEIEDEKEVYYLKLDKVVSRLKKFKDLFNEELVYKLDNPKAIYSQLAEMKVLIVTQKNEQYKTTKIIPINYTYDDNKKSIDNYVKNIRFFRIDVKEFNNFIEEHLTINETLERKHCKNVSSEIRTIYPILTNKQIEIYLINLIKNKFNINSLDKVNETEKLQKIEKYKNGFNCIIKSLYKEFYDWDKKCEVQDVVDNANEFIIYKIKIEFNSSIEDIDDQINMYLNGIEISEVNDDLEYEGIIEGIRLYIKQEIAKKQKKELIKLRKINNIDSSNDIDVDEVLKKFNI